MKKTIIALMLSSAMSAQGATRLDCYEKYHLDIIEKKQDIIKVYDNLIEIEEDLLSMIFNPEKYGKGPFPPLIGRAKDELKRERLTTINFIKSEVKISNDLNNALKYCLSTIK